MMKYSSLLSSDDELYIIDIVSMEDESFIYVTIYLVKQLKAEKEKKTH